MLAQEQAATPLLSDMRFNALCAYCLPMQWVGAGADCFVRAGFNLPKGVASGAPTALQAAAIC